MSSKVSKLSCSQNLSNKPVRAVYYPTSEGLKLGKISEFNSRKFRNGSGWEEIKIRHALSELVKSEEVEAEDLAYIPEAYLEGIELDLSKEDMPKDELFKRLNQIRAQRRARQNALDMIICNPDMDLFSTLTYAPDDERDRCDYDACYKDLKPWLSNRVSRNGLKYVIAAERHKKGGIHFHMISNASALKLDRAVSPKSGRFLTHGKKPLYNLVDWKHGFSSAEDISGEDAQTKVAKYVFKYMTKNEQKIGGRYLLHGGKMTMPVYAYGESVDEFLGDAEGYYGGELRHEKTVNIGEIQYRELNFI